LSKGAKSRTHARGIRSTRTKVRTRISRVREPRAELEKKLETRTRELDEAREQLAATSEVLQVISSSPGALKPVFQAMLENATRICEAAFGSMLLGDGDPFRRVALHNAPQNFAEFSERAPSIRSTDASTLDLLVRTKQVVHVADLATEGPDEPLAKFAGARTLLTVPMLKENQLIGAMGIYRQEVRPFTDKQIELVQNFAAQAVIAIENTRLLNELRHRTNDLSEALEQQTATSEVLQVISSSPGELEPVFQAMLQNSVRICQAKFGQMFRYENNGFRYMAQVGAPPPSSSGTSSAASSSHRPEAPFPGSSSPERWSISPTSHPSTPQIRRRGLVAHGRIWGRRIDWRDCDLPPGSPTVHRQADRVSYKLRQPSRHRYRECAPSQRAAPAHG
jgi:DNA-binding FrmR family transcriptional regulator